MADSQEQKIITAIVARMQTILTANGYVTNIGTTVADSQPNWDQDDDLPAISIFQGEVTAEPSERDRRKSVRIMPVMIKVFFEKLSTNTLTAAYARNAIKDVHKAIRGTGTQRDGWLAERWPAVAATPPGLAMETREKSHRFVYTEGSYEIAGAEIEIEVVYITDKFNLEA